MDINEFAVRCTKCKSGEARRLATSFLTTHFVRRLEHHASSFTIDIENSKFGFVAIHLNKDHRIRKLTLCDPPAPPIKLFPLKIKN